jgi:energy-converting hydrogenase Eha subunit A
MSIRPLLLVAAVVSLGVADAVLPEGQDCKLTCPPRESWAPSIVFATIAAGLVIAALVHWLRERSAAG